MTDEYRLRLGDTVKIEGESWVWEAVRRGVEAKLRRDGTADDWLVLSLPELLAHGGTARREKSFALRPALGTWPADVVDMEKHLLEAFDGIPMTETAVGPRPQYDTETTTQEGLLHG